MAVERLNLVLFAIVFSLSVHQTFSQITFTGDATKDFNITDVNDPRVITLLVTPNNNKVSTSKWMATHNQTSGFDVKSTNVQYDYKVDTLYMAVDCWVICGDADGDGNPGVSTDRGNIYNLTSPPNPSYIDTPLQATVESISVTMWTNPPDNFVPGVNSFAGYEPDIVFGEDFDRDLTSFDAYNFPVASVCTAGGLTGPVCDAAKDSMNSSPGFNYNYNIWTYGNFSLIRKTEKLQLFAYPNATHPDLEWAVPTFSQYGNFDFTPGISNIRYAFALVSSSVRDSCGEEIQYPLVQELRCQIFDACGVCGGDNTTCVGCDHVPLSGKTYDECGICGGDSSSCWDCAHVPNGPAQYDACGVCDGDNQTCWDCAHIPNGPARYDACGVCDGDNTTCWDCAHIPNGPALYDFCGVCDGDNTTCWDCAHIPNGHAQYDACGVCDGNNQTCWDCAHIPNGDKVYDQCGVCGGDSTSCADCEGVPNGGKVYDGCGICGGNGLECQCLYPDFFLSDIVFPAEDTWIELANRLANHFDDDKLEVKWNRSRTLVQFRDVCHTILQKHKHKSPLEHTQILSANLTFNVIKTDCGWDDKDIAIHRIREYEEKRASWECSGFDVDNCCKAWRMIGLPPQVVADYRHEPSGVKQLEDGQLGGQLTFDVTEEVDKLVYQDGPCETLSYLLKKVCEHGAGCAWFHRGPVLTVRVKTFCPRIPEPPTPKPPCPDDELAWNWDADKRDLN